MAPLHQIAFVKGTGIQLIDDTEAALVQPGASRGPPGWWQRVRSKNYNLRVFFLLLSIRQKMQFNLFLSIWAIFWQFVKIFRLQKFTQIAKKTAQIDKKRSNYIFWPIDKSKKNTLRSQF